ncbi:hypothetical protein [Maritalea sp.]|jgi:hypothetical protein|uniref:hypothetical protein n=1 Tax=Maritalea sp. TaxID=2003361 RepID=UPI0039E60264
MNDAAGGAAGYLAEIKQLEDQLTRQLSEVEGQDILAELKRNDHRAAHEVLVEDGPMRTLNDNDTEAAGVLQSFTTLARKFAQQAVFNQHVIAKFLLEEKKAAKNFRVQVLMLLGLIVVLLWALLLR